MTIKTLGFIGLGVMGEPMCRNLATKSNCDIVAYDLNQAPLDRAAEDGVKIKRSVAEVAQAADIIFLSLPSGEHLKTVCLDPDGLLAQCRAGQTVVDTSTSPVKLTREMASRFQEAGIDYADAPIARTRQAAIEGTLSIMVGGSETVYQRILPYLNCMASEVTHCGEVGTGEIVKLMNNMILFQTVVALSEALAIGKRAGIDGEVLFNTLTKGSADSFALRNHGLKAILPGVFPELAFPTEYAQKDLKYALQLAEESGIDPAGAKTAARMLEASRKAGYGNNYFPALVNVIDSDKT